MFGLKFAINVEIIYFIDSQKLQNFFHRFSHLLFFWLWWVWREFYFVVCGEFDPQNTMYSRFDHRLFLPTFDFSRWYLYVGMLLVLVLKCLWLIVQDAGSVFFGLPLPNDEILKLSSLIRTQSMVYARNANLC